MASNGESKEATRALDALYIAAMRYADGAQRQSSIFAEMFTELGAITKARRTRLHLAEGVIPVGLWAVLIAGAVLTVGFTFFFGTENLRAQVTMIGMLSLMVFLGLFVIVSFDYPFTGDVRVTPEPLSAVLENFVREKG